MVSKKRHLLKAITWRIVGTIDTMVVAFIITGNPLTGLKVGGMEVLTKITLYYLHERAWLTSKYGINKTLIPKKVK